MRFHRGLDELRWANVALPTGWSHYRVVLGNHHVGMGQYLARKGQLTEALAYAQAGLARIPQHREGRRLLGRLLMATGRQGAAQELLVEGLVYHADHPHYLAELFAVLFSRQEDDRTLAVAQKILSRPQTPPDVCQLATLAAATAYFLRGNYDQAEDFVQSDSTLAGSLEGRLLACRINWERGHHELALMQLHTLAIAFPDAWDVHSYWTSCLRLAHRDAEARSASLAFQIRHPSLPGPRLDLLHAHHAAGDLERRRRETDSLLAEFAADSSVLVQLAGLAADWGDVPLTRRLLDHARSHGMPWEPHVFHHVEALIVARDFQGASQLLRAVVREQPDWSTRYGQLLDGLQAVVSLGLGDNAAARLYLARVVLHPSRRAEPLLALAKRIGEFGTAEQAREILLHAFAGEPRNQAVLTRLVELDLNLNRIDQLPAHLETLVTMRQPSPEILRVAQHKLGSDLFLFSADRAPALDAVRFALEGNRSGAPRF